MGLPQPRWRCSRSATQPSGGSARPREGAGVTEVEPEGGPTVGRMLIGSTLRRLRTEKGITREEAAEAIRASAWKIHRLENGQVGFKDRDLVDLLELYGFTDQEEVAALLELAREANSPGWWFRYGDLVPPWFRTYMDLEAAATLIRTYQAQLVPGLLQTADYARATIAGMLLPRSPEEVERRVTLKLARQQILEKPDGPRLWAVVDEAALRRPVGAEEVMREQLERLIDAANLPSVVLQVLPVSVGAHSAMAGAFSILRFADRELPDIVYIEHLTNAHYLDKLDDVNQYLHVIDSISMHAAPPGKTVEILHQILKEFSSTPPAGRR
jgi:transcriptional regulator with XRE-family HTH domain